ncbi:N-acetylmuramoyl-L-alanine amidase [Faecalimicrobium sp. JNUCC 81]
MIIKINVHAGHGLDGSKSCGAIGLIKESTEARKVKDEVIKLLKLEGHTVYDCTVDYPDNQNDCINKIVGKCNSNKVDVDISIHFNSGAKDTKGNGKTTGVEVWVYNSTSKAKPFAERIEKQMSKLGFKSRGIKYTNKLGVLKTNNPNLLIECCFVDDKDDVNIYNYKDMSKAIVEGILNKSLSQNININKKHTNAILYGNDIDKVAAEILSWSKEDCIVKNVKDHISWEATNLFIVGGPAKVELDKMKTGEKYTTIAGNDRYDTVRKCLNHIGK